MESLIAHLVERTAAAARHDAMQVSSHFFAGMRAACPHTGSVAVTMSAHDEDTLRCYQIIANHLGFRFSRVSVVSGFYMELGFPSIKAHIRGENATSVIKRIDDGILRAIEAAAAAVRPSSIVVNVAPQFLRCHSRVPALLAHENLRMTILPMRHAYQTRLVFRAPVSAFLTHALSDVAAEG